MPTLAAVSKDKQMSKLPSYALDDTNNILGSLKSMEQSCHKVISNNAECMYAPNEISDTIKKAILQQSFLNSMIAAARRYPSS